jgi:hypothetical protein
MSSFHKIEIIRARFESSVANVLHSEFFLDKLPMRREAREYLNQLKQEYFAYFHPTNNLELDAVHEMISAKWKQHGLSDLEKALLEAERCSPTAVEDKAEAITAIERCDAVYSRQYDRAYHRLWDLRHPDPDAPRPAQARRRPDEAKRIKNPHGLCLVTAKRSKRRMGREMEPAGLMLAAA